MQIFLPCIHRDISQFNLIFNRVYTKKLELVLNQHVYQSCENKMYTCTFHAVLSIDLKDNQHFH